MSVLQKNYMNQFYREGGKISKVGRMSRDEVLHDTVPSILQIGEIVIPRKVAQQKKFIKTLKKFGYKKGKFFI